VSGFFAKVLIEKNMFQFKLGKAVMKIKLGFFRELPAINCTFQPRADV